MPDESLKAFKSRRVRCPKCGAEGVRLRRLKNVDPLTHYWIHNRPGQQPCAVRISHYRIKDDPAYQPEVAA